MKTKNSYLQQTLVRRICSITLALALLSIVFVVVVVLLSSSIDDSTSTNDTIQYGRFTRFAEVSERVVFHSKVQNNILYGKLLLYLKDDKIRRNTGQPIENGILYRNISRLMERENIKNNSYHYSEYPHEPGSKRNGRLGREMAKQWKKYGFDKTEIFKYRVLLSFPEKPAEIHLTENSHLKKKIIVINEPAFGTSEKKGKPIYPFNAYSISGNVTGRAVFCNYGKNEDYKLLLKLNVELKNKIFVLRYDTKHARSRSLLMTTAMEHGAIAVIFYSDPQDYTYPAQDYPEGWMLNKFGTQRGNIGSKVGYIGDRLSIEYPSKEHYYRDKISRMKKHLYKIPSQPISGHLAAELFNFMDDDSIELPASFKGGLNSTYALQSGKNKTITLRINNKLEDSISLVVCGSLFGSLEPDRYIIIGNHRDAWTYGSADPVSGSAVMTEIVRVLGEYKLKMKYRPRRSIMVCSWGAEEMGMLGSAEWAEENVQFLTQKAIAYLNVDMAVEGNYTMKLKCLDNMAQSLFQAAKHVLSPDNSSITLFQEMCHKHAVLNKLKNDLKVPLFETLSGESDTISFSQRHGIGISDYRYVYNTLEFPKLIAHNGQYHTLYDSYEWMSTFVDPTYRYHLTLGKLWLTHALILADTTIIPLDMKTFVEQLAISFYELEKKYNCLLKKKNISLEVAKESLKELVAQVTIFVSIIKILDTGQLSFIKIRAINDVIMNFGRQFMLRSEVGIRSLKQIYTVYKSFIGIEYAITKEPGNNWDNVRKEITLLVWCVDMATKSLDLSELMLEELIR